MSPLHHVALGARNVARVTAFYRDLLGLAELERHYTPTGELRSIWLGLGEAMLMIEHTTASPHRIDGVGHGPFLLAVRVNPAERWALEERLGRAGHPLESRTGHTSYFRDPEGNRVAISHYPEAPSEANPEAPSEPEA